MLSQVVRGDKEAEDKLPKVIKDSLKASQPSNKRSFSTTASSRQSLPSDMFVRFKPFPDQAIVAAGTTAMADPEPQELGDAAVSKVGHKFGLPTLPLPARSRIDKRHEAIVDQVVGLIMRDGKKAAAQRVCDTRRCQR